jgi:succinate dehydrogenase / fumarate reductase iron-sulfur subunit
MRFIIKRHDPATTIESYNIFEVERTPGMTVLDALFLIQDTMDSTLAFRYSCRGAVCGSCAMLIDKVPRLACRTQVADLLGNDEPPHLKPYPALEPTVPHDPSNEVLVEPLPHLPVLKDLVVDMEDFYRKYMALQPMFRPEGEPPDTERPMDPADVSELEKFTNCILCGACYGACPVDAENINYLGPAALAKAYRFHIDPREGDDVSRLLLAHAPEGWWACEFHGNCRTVCPKGVPPILAIGKAKRELEASGFKDPSGGR